MSVAYLSIGSNLGNKYRHLLYGIACLRGDKLTYGCKVSHFYETSPVGNVVQNNFINAGIVLNTKRDPFSLLSFIHDIEQSEHRYRFVHWGPRTLDIDIIFYDDLKINTDNLIIPHKEFGNRLFVIKPLLEISNDNKISNLLLSCLNKQKRDQKIRRIN